MGLRLVHITDPHEEWEKLDVVSSYIAERKADEERKVDAVLFTGDAIEGTEGKYDDNTVDVALRSYMEETGYLNIKATERELGLFLREHSISSPEQVATLEESVQEEFRELAEEHQQLMEQYQANHSEAVRNIDIDFVLQTIENSYREAARHFKAIRDQGVPIFGVLGNHDFPRTAYEFLDKEFGGPITFVERRSAVGLRKGETTWVFQGDINTYEVPFFQRILLEAIEAQEEPIIVEELFVKYLSGHSLSERRLSPQQRDKLEQLMTEERERLGEPRADIYLTHKVPFGNQYGSNDIAPIYAQRAKSTHAGHDHGMQIGYLSEREVLDMIQNGNHTEFRDVDGIEVPVFKLSEDQPWQLNPGVNHFFAEEYDDNKEPERVIIYEFTYN